MKKQTPKAVAAYLSAMGYRRTSNSGQIVARLDDKDWLVVLAKSHFDDYNWAYIAGPEMYLRYHTRDTLVVADNKIFKMVPTSVHDRTTYREMTANNKKTLEQLIDQEIVTRYHSVCLT